MKHVFLKFVAVATLLATSASVSAFVTSTPITGTIDFVGMAKTTVVDKKITKIDFLSGNDKDKMLINNKTGTFEKEVTANKAKFFDLSSWPSENGGYQYLWTVNQADLLWKVNGFKFEINNIISNEWIPEFGGIAGFVASGTISKTGYETTEAEFTYSTQFAKNGETSEHSFSATAVPAPATIALLGLALIGFGAARRKKQA